MSNLAIVRWGKGEPDSAVDLLKSAHEVFVSSGDARGQAASLDRMGEIHISLHLWEPAERALRAARDIYEGLGDTQGVATVTCDMGDLFLEKGDIGMALHHYEQSLTFARKLGDISLLAENYRRMGEAFRQMGSGAYLDYFRKAAEMYERAGWNGVAEDIRRMLAQAQ